eukprot:jgi/Botrbrau1/23475/Bobra.106_1s0029.2
MLPSSKRKKLLSERYMFDCTCVRCTEAGEGRNADWFLSATRDIAGHHLTEEEGEEAGEELAQKALEALYRGTPAQELEVELLVASLVLQGLHPFHHHCLDACICLQSLFRLGSKEEGKQGRAEVAAQYALVLAAAAECLLASGELAAWQAAARFWSDAGTMLLYCLSHRIAGSRTPQHPPGSRTVPETQSRQHGSPGDTSPSLSASRVSQGTVGERGIPPSASAPCGALVPLGRDPGGGEPAGRGPGSPHGDPRVPSNTSNGNPRVSDTHSAPIGIEDPGLYKRRRLLQEPRGQEGPIFELEVHPEEADLGMSYEGRIDLRDAARRLRDLPAWSRGAVTPPGGAGVPLQGGVPPAAAGGLCELAERDVLLPMGAPPTVPQGFGEAVAAAWDALCPRPIPAELLRIACVRTPGGDRFPGLEDEVPHGGLSSGSGSRSCKGDAGDGSDSCCGQAGRGEGQCRGTSRQAADGARGRLSGTLRDFAQAIRGELEKLVLQAQVAPAVQQGALEDQLWDRDLSDHGDRRDHGDHRDHGDRRDHLASSTTGAGALGNGVEKGDGNGGGFKRNRTESVNNGGERQTEQDAGNRAAPAEAPSSRRGAGGAAGTSQEAVWEVRGDARDAVESALTLAMGGLACLARAARLLEVANGATHPLTETNAFAAFQNLPYALAAAITRGVAELGTTQQRPALPRRAVCSG